MPTRINESSVLNSRITSIDSLRGFALAGIVIVHMVEQYLGGPIPENLDLRMVQGPVDQVVEGFIFFFFRGKFFALFAFLFGVSFFIQMDRAAQKNIDFRGRFIWRLTLLLIFGIIHNMFYRGDILTIYVLIGFLLPPFYSLPNKWLVLVSLFVFLGAGRFISFAIFGSDSIFGGPDFSPSSEDTLAYWEILKNGTLLEVFKDNTTNGLLAKLDFQFGAFGRGYLTFGFFLIGLWAGRSKLFQRFAELKKPIIKVLWWSVGFSIISLLATFGLFSLAPQPVKFDNWMTMFALTAYDIHNVAMTALIICGFLLIYHKKQHSALQVFSNYGKMALSNYVIQSVIGTFIFYGWGLGYLGDVRNIYVFGLGLFIIIAQIVMSNFWMKNFKYGPFEWLWRCGTHMKKMPFLKKTE